MLPRLLLLVIINIGYRRKIMHLVTCVCPSVRALLAELFDLGPLFAAWGSTLT